MDKVLMKCGHVETGTVNGTRGCVSCGGLTPDAVTPAEVQPALEGRKAKCTYSSCSNIRESSLNLAFFKFKGKGSHTAINICKCNYSVIAHKKPNYKCKFGEFRAKGPQEYDEYYCGCRGWD